jgi:hypothetical protein
MATRIVGQIRNFEKSLEVDSIPMKIRRDQDVVSNVTPDFDNATNAGRRGQVMRGRRAHCFD